MTKRVELPNNRYISHDPSEYGIDREKAETLKNAKFVGVFCLYQRGVWINSPVEVFYQESSPYPCPYFALLVQHGNLFITSAESTVGIPIWGVVADDGEVIYSRYRHDYRTSKDGSVTIDGGRDYTKSSSNGTQVCLTIKDGSLQIVEDQEEIEILQQRLKLLR